MSIDDNPASGAAVSGAKSQSTPQPVTEERPPSIAAAAARPRGTGLIARTFDSLSLPQFRIFWFGTLLSMGATQMNMMTNGILVYDIQDSRIIAGIVGMAFAPTMLVFSLFGGVAVDRFDRRLIMQLAQISGVLVAGVLAALVFFDLIRWYYLLIGGLLQGATFAFLGPARQTAIPRLVGKDQMSNAVALNMAGMSLMSVAAPALGGLLYERITPGGVYALSAGMSVAAVVLTGRLPSIKPGAFKHRAVFAEIVIGFGYIRRTPVVLWLIFQGGLTALLTFPFRTLLPVYAKDVYIASPSDVGIMMATLGVGTLLGTLFMAGLRQGQSRGVFILSASVLTAAALAVIAGVPWLLVGTLCMVLIGLGDSGRMALGQSLVLEACDDEYRGRVMSIFMMTWGLMPLGVLPLSAGFDLLGPQLALGVMATLALVVSLAFFAQPRLRKLG